MEVKRNSLPLNYPPQEKRNDIESLVNTSWKRNGGRMGGNGELGYQ